MLRMYKKSCVHNLFLSVLTLYFLVLIGAALFTGCVKVNAPVDLQSINPGTLIHLQTLQISGWQDTQIYVQPGDIIILVPSYPKGSPASIKGKVTIDGEMFSAMDTSTNDPPYLVQSRGTLHIGKQDKVETITVGVLIFRNQSMTDLVDQLERLYEQLPEQNLLKLATGILYKNQLEKFITTLPSQQAIELADRAIESFMTVDMKLYSWSIYRLYKIKAELYQEIGDFDLYQTSLEQSYLSLLKASQYYDLALSDRLRYIDELTPEEKTILLTRTSFFQNLNRTDGELRFGFSHSNLAVVYVLLTRYFTDQGDLERSLLYGEKALHAAQEKGNPNLESFVRTRGIGTRHLSFGFYELALDEFRKARELATTQAIWTRWSASYSENVTKFLVGQLPDSTEYFAKTLRRLQESTVRKHHIRHFLAESLMKDGEYPEAENYFKQAYHGFKKGIGKTGFISVAHHLRSGVGWCESLLAQNKTEEAHLLLELLEADLVASNQPLRYELKIRLLQSRLAGLEDRDVLDPLLAAIKTLEEIRPTAKNKFDYEYWQSMLAVYNRTVDQLFDNGQIEQALEVAEKARARRFLDFLGSKQLGIKERSAKRHQLLAKTQLEALTKLEEEIVYNADSQQITLRSLREPSGRIGRGFSVINDIERKLSESSEIYQNMYFSSVGNLPSLTHLVPKNTTILEYYISGKYLYCWLINSAGITAERSVIDSVTLERLIGQLSSGIRSGFQLEASGFQRTIPITHLSEQLYKILIKPVEQQIETENLCIVPYGILNYVPFQVLIDTQNRYLVERFALSYLPSFSTLNYVLTESLPQKLRVLAIGNPDLNDAKLDLPAAELEVNRIKAIYPDTITFLREAATEAAFKREAKHFDVIHLATHGHFRRDVPMKSALYFAAGDGEDGNLEISEIIDLDLNARFVVASACETAMGHIQKGDEIIGLTRAFMFAGGKSIVGSLWAISDEATAEFMSSFYQSFTRQSSLKAMQQAQLELINSTHYHDPFFWGAFNLTGSLQ